MFIYYIIYKKLSIHSVTFVNIAFKPNAHVIDETANSVLLMSNTFAQSFNSSLATDNFSSFVSTLISYITRSRS